MTDFMYITAETKLFERLWPEDLEVEDRIVDSHIKNIRKKLNDDYIKTIRGVGYRIDKMY